MIYVCQDKPLGIAYIVGPYRDFVDDNKFVVYSGNNMPQNGIKGYSEKFPSEDYNEVVF